MLTMMAAHGLRVSELCDLRWEDVLFDEGKLNVRRRKNGKASVHFVTGDELRDLRRLLRDVTASRWIFCGTNGAPLTRYRVYDVVRRAERVAKLPVVVSPHSLRHSAGYRLVNDRNANLRAVQDYLGHRNIASTVVYSEMASDRFADFERLK